jgi:tetratricopeptide (TPR) repeat protein
MARMHLPVRLVLPRRQVLLFLVAILVPCGVLVALGLQMMEQEHQLEDKRLAEDHQRLIGRVRQELLSDLEEIKLHQLTRTVARDAKTDFLQPDGPVAFVGLLDGGQLQLPWENNATARDFPKWIGEGVFAERIREAETFELVTNQYENAASRYRAAIDAAREPAQKNYARLSLARTLQKLGNPHDSQAEFGRVLTSAPDLVDEHDVPLGFYAALALLHTGSQQDKIIEWIRVATDRQRLLPPAALRMARDLAGKVGASDSVSSLNDLIRDRERAEALQRDLGRLIPATQSREPIWTAYGEPTWLTSITPPVGVFDGLVLAVRADDILKRLGFDYCGG